MARIRLGNPHQIQRQFTFRISFLVVIITVLAGILLLRMINLQIIDYQHYSTLAQGNRVQLRPVPPTRGLIYDRHNRILAENIPTYRLDIIPEQVEDLDETIIRLSQIIDLTSGDTSRFRKQVKRQRIFSPSPLKFQLTEEEVARFSVNRSSFPGVRIEADLSRHYPFGELTAHVIGYVANLDEQDLKQFDEAQYAGTTHIGKTGLEKHYENTLHGQTGYQRVEVNAHGRAVSVIEGILPVPGENLRLSLDIELQKAAYEALGEEKGAIVALNPNTGEILALVSTPSFDPNLFVNGISQKNYSALQNNQDMPLFNRVLRGQYPPGSTLKPFIGIAELEYAPPISHQGIYCNGSFSLPNSDRKHRDWKRGGHGWTNLDKSIAQSCDVYFYQLAVELGIDNIEKMLHKFGFGQITGLDVPSERPGLLPSREWKREKYNEPWFPGETVNVGIGQGFMLTTPLQLAHATGMIANHGYVYKPHLVMNNASKHQLPTIALAEKSSWFKIINSMRRVIHSPRGTASGIRKNLQYDIAGKTGTAQVFGLAEDEKYDAESLQKRLRDHALFIAFAPVDAPKIALSVIVENGGSGGVVAAPIARKVLDAYLRESSP